MQNKHMNLVSVVVVVYNSSETVVETLDTILKQTYRNIELIVTDDCSTDDTVKIVKSWMIENHKRFARCGIVKNKKNLGVTKNCNIGITKVKGKYIQLSAGDDLLYPEAIRKKVEYAEMEQCPYVFSKMKAFGNNIKSVNDVNKIFEKNYKIMRSDWKTQDEQIEIRNFVISPMFYTKKFFNEMCGYDERFPMLEDYPFVFKIIKSGYRINLLEEELAGYRVTDNSLSHAGSSAYIKSCKKFFYKVRIWELIKKRKFKEMYEQIQEFCI